MSSSFSYELDEEQIRSTLLNGGQQESVDSAWDDFEANYVQNATTPHPIKFKLPEFNLNINRNIVLPVLFIAALVGISAIMLSFVDFKTNAPAGVEKALIPDPDNYKAEETKAAVLVKKEPEKVIEKPVEVKKDTVSEKPEVTVPITQPPVQKVVNIPTATLNPNNYAARTNTQSAQNSQPESKITTSQDSTARSVQSGTNTFNQTAGKGRKRRRKITPEQVETIKAPSILGTESSKKEEEPELELKLN
jgi:hypothetical protein